MSMSFWPGDTTPPTVNTCRPTTWPVAGDRTCEHAVGAKRGACHRALRDPRQRLHHHRRRLLGKMADRAADTAQSTLERIEEALEILSGKARAINLRDQRIDLLVGEFGEARIEMFAQGRIIGPIPIHVSIHGLTPST